jgi:hypothetical protein
MKTNNLFKIIFCLLFFAGATFSATSTQIDYPEVPGKPNIFNTGKLPLLPAYMNYMIGMLITVAGVVILFIAVKAGFKYFISRGNSSKTGEAKDDISAAFIGLFILLSSYLILTFVSPNYATLTLSTQTIGIVLSNGGGDDLLVSSGNANLSDYIPNKITISKNYKDNAEINLYSSPNYTGSVYRVKKTDWTCNETECTFAYPLAYRKGSITVLILRPGVFVYKNKKVPYYAGKDIPNLMAVNEFINIDGSINGIRIYNSEASNYGAVAFSDSDYVGPGVLYFPAKKAGWASDDIIDLKEIESIRVFNARSINKDSVEFFHLPEYDYEGKCTTEDDTISSVVLQKIKCPWPNIFVYSLKLNRAWAVLISSTNTVNSNPGRSAECLDYIVQIQKGQGIVPFCFAEMIKTSDPNMDDNKEIGQCLCTQRSMGIFWCTNWQSCASHALIISQ